jgi:hypothetical protein
MHMSGKLTWRGLVRVPLARKRMDVLRACAVLALLLLLPVSCGGGGTSEQSGGTQTSVAPTTVTGASTETATSNETAPLASAYAEDAERAVTILNSDIKELIRLSRALNKGDDAAVGETFQLIQRILDCSKVVDLDPPPNFEELQALLEKACKTLRQGASSYAIALTTNDAQAGETAGKKIRAARQFLRVVRETLLSH